MTARNEIKRRNENPREVFLSFAHDDESCRYEEGEGFKMTLILFTSFTAVQLSPGDQAEKAEN